MPTFLFTSSQFVNSLFLSQEQKLLKMGDELSRLASFEAECYRKDGVIVSLRNEIADLRSLLSMKEDADIRYS